MQYDYEHREQIPVYANGIKDVSDRLRRHHWMVPVKFDQLPKIQLKVRMCCKKCEEMVMEEIWEVPGVFDVRAMRPKKVVVVAMPDGPYSFGLDEYEVLRKAKKIDCRAKFVDLDVTERPKPPKIPEPVVKPPVKPPRETKLPDYREENASMWSMDYRPLYEPNSLRPPVPPYQEPYVHYFHLLLIALFVSIIFLREPFSIQRMFPCCL